MRNIARLPLLFVLLLTLSLGACDSVKEDDAPSIDGVYELQSNDGSVAFLHIDASTTTLYEYYDSDATQGSECYISYSDDVSLVREGNVLFYEETFDDGTIRYDIRLSGSVLVYTFSENGETISTSRWDRSRRSVSSFTPDCSDDFSPKR